MDPCGPCCPGSRMEPRTLAAKWGGGRRVGRQEAAKCPVAEGWRRMLRAQEEKLCVPLCSAQVPEQLGLKVWAPCQGGRKSNKELRAWWWEAFSLRARSLPGPLSVLCRRDPEAFHPLSLPQTDPSVFLSIWTLSCQPGLSKISASSSLLGPVMEWSHEGRERTLTDHSLCARHVLSALPASSSSHNKQKR